MKNYYLTEEYRHYNCYNEIKIKDFIQLLKPRIIFLVIFTSIIGMFLANKYTHPIITTISIICIAMGSGGASAINMWFDHDIDAIMTRTKKRPIPSGIIPKETALEIGVILSFFSVFIMAFAVNYLSSFLLAFSILFYVFIYTIFLKRKTPQNVVIGGIPGALPPMIGYTAIANTITLESFLLFLIVFLWTPPHSWALSIINYKDYKNAKIPMLPITHGILYTKKNILFYSMLLLIASLSLYFFQINGYIYLVGALILNIIFIFYGVKVYINSKYSYKMFKFSILYLFALFTFVAIDKLIILR